MSAEAVQECLTSCEKVSTVVSSILGSSSSASTAAALGAGVDVAAKVRRRDWSLVDGAYRCLHL